MTDHEKLIEDARNIVRSWDLKGSWNPDSPIGMLELLADALEAAEKAHAPTTPTDDEREAHRQVIDLWFANWRYIAQVSPALEVAIDSLEGMVSDALDAGFRRTEVPEPSVCQSCHGLKGSHFSTCPAPQGEPSESLEAALSYLDDLIRDRQIWYDDYSSLHDLVSSALSAAGGEGR